MKGKLFFCLAKEFEQKTEEFFEANKDLGEVKFVSVCMGYGGEGFMIAVFFEEKDQPVMDERR